jgi:UDP-2,3-diacylglucosamine pyrophosphatase LpxH
MKKTDYRSIFIIDTHLGTRGCRDEQLLDFLKNNTCDNLYLVGDIIDGWRMQKGVYWPERHTEIIRCVLRKSNKGTQVEYVVGNHDEALRQYIRDEISFGNISVSNRQDYVSLSGKRYLVVHGDMFDNLMRADLKWIMHLGDKAYEILIWANTKLNAIRKMFGMEYWSLSKYLKDRTKRAVNFINKFEEQLADYARKNDYDGVICGHIHHPQMTVYDDVEYINTGDWVENCTAVVETHKGEFRVIHWSKNSNNK